MEGRLEFWGKKIDEIFENFEDLRIQEISRIKQFPETRVDLNCISNSSALILACSEQVLLEMVFSM